MARDPQAFRTIICENPTWEQEMEALKFNCTDRDLCRLQEEQSSRGYIPAELVKSIYGWGLRYASGLQGFGIIAASKQRSGPLDGTLRHAVQWALDWAKKDPTNRDVYVRTYNLTAEDIAVLDELAPQK